ncbi:MAG: 50S ribosomal protein L13 [Candidatus Niyogibacteria bacterium]|nr:50S ribosomal protein L13 [Candidatus Niyogibacteria bacterium]
MVKKTIKKLKNEKTIDASGQILGRFASRMAFELTGKNDPSYERHVFVPRSITIVNASKIRVSGKKIKQKIYNRYTGYPSGLKKRTIEEQLRRDSREIIRRAIWGMLPKNKLRKRYMQYLTITN